MKLKSLMIMLLTMIISTTAFSQIMDNHSVQVMVKGTVYDEFSNQPAGVQVIFKDKTGKKIKIRTNDEDGTFAQLLKAGQTYKITFTNYNILRKVTEYTVPNASEFKEIDEEFSVQKLAPGRELSNHDIFDDGSAQISAEGKKALNDIKIDMRFNRTVYLDFKISAADTYPDASSAEADQLVKDRIAAIEAYIDNWRGYNRRITLTTAKTVSGDAPAGTDLILSVNKIKDVFD